VATGVAPLPRRVRRRLRAGAPVATPYAPDGEGTASIDPLIGVGDRVFLRVDPPSDLYERRYTVLEYDIASHRYLIRDEAGELLSVRRAAIYPERERLLETLLTHARGGAYQPSTPVLSTAHEPECAPARQPRWTGLCELASRGCVIRACVWVDGRAACEHCAAAARAPARREPAAVPLAAWPAPGWREARVAALAENLKALLARRASLEAEGRSSPGLDSQIAALRGNLPVVNGGPLPPRFAVLLA